MNAIAKESMQPISKTTGPSPRSDRRLLVMVLVAVLALCLMVPDSAHAAPTPDPSQDISITLSSSEQGGLSSALKVLLLLTLLAFAPAIIISLTSFTRIVVVLAFARQALGTQQTPPNQVIIGIALFLTMFTMAPTAAKIHEQAVAPYLGEKIDETQAFEKGLSVLKQFMLKHTRISDLELFYEISKESKPDTAEDIPIRILAPSFVLSELKTAFQMGFCIFIPFLLLDMLISAVLMAMGMMMLPPVLISLPFKLLLFVLVDGWQLLVGSVARGFM